MKNRRQIQINRDKRAQQVKKDKEWNDFIEFMTNPPLLNKSKTNEDKR